MGKEKNELQLIKLVEFLASRQQINGAAFACGALINLYTSEERYKECVRLLETAKTLSIPIKSISLKILINLKEKIEATGGQFPFTLPENETRNRRNQNGRDEHVEP